MTVKVITIDGPTASGKGTVASRVAEALGFHYLDSGALYRLTAYRSLKAGVALDDAEKVALQALDMHPTFKDGEIYLDGEVVTNAIRQEEVGIAASKVAALPEVRTALESVQKRSAQAPGLVADGRDMGSVIFPNAQLKVFLTASAEARAQRRYNQLKQKGISANIETLAHDLRERDRRDMERAVCPLAPAVDAKILDSSDLGIEETVAQVLQWYKESQQ